MLPCHEGICAMTFQGPFHLSVLCQLSGRGGALKSPSSAAVVPDGSNLQPMATEAVYSHAAAASVIIRASWKELRITQLMALVVSHSQPTLHHFS